jgi:alcohol dehydrogenase class IV
MELPQVLKFTYSTVQRDIVCQPDAISRIESTFDASAERQALIAKAMGINITALTPEQAGMAAADAVADLCRTLGLPIRLRDVDVPATGLELIATATLHDRGLATNLKPIHDATPILQVLHNAW